jgi:hypothetical protein
MFNPSSENIIRMLESSKDKLTDELEKLIDERLLLLENICNEEHIKKKNIKTSSGDEEQKNVLQINVLY